MQHPVTLTDGPVTLRPLAPADASLLLRWLTDVRVLEYWEGPHAVFTSERIREHYFEDEWNASRWIIEYEAAPIGYVQAYQLDEEMFSEYEYPYTDSKVYGIDQFIGEPEYWGKGIGRRFVKLLCGYLHENASAQAVVLDPHAGNERAIRCYEACGFRKLKFLPRHELHDGVMVDCWLMALDF